MIPRRGFFGKLAALIGLSALPVQANEESAERKLRREKMAAKGLGPDDVRLEYVWDHDLDGNPVLRCYIDCHGETYGRLMTLHLSEALPQINGVLITPIEIKSTEGPTVPRHG